MKSELNLSNIDGTKVIQIGIPDYEVFIITKDRIENTIGKANNNIEYLIKSEIIKDSCGKKLIFERIKSHSKFSPKTLDQKFIPYSDFELRCSCGNKIRGSSGVIFCSQKSCHKYDTSRIDFYLLSSIVGHNPRNLLTLLDKKKIKQKKIFILCIQILKN